MCWYHCSSEPSLFWYLLKGLYCCVNSFFKVYHCVEGLGCVGVWGRQLWVLISCWGLLGGCRYVWGYVNKRKFRLKKKDNWSITLILWFLGLWGGVREVFGAFNVFGFLYSCITVVYYLENLEIPTLWRGKSWECLISFYRHPFQHQPRSPGFQIGRRDRIYVSSWPRFCQR